MSFGMSLGDDRGMTKLTTEITEETKQSARMTVCHYSTSADEAEETMRMLGIHFDQDDEELT